MLNFDTIKFSIPARFCSVHDISSFDTLKKTRFDAVNVYEMLVLNKKIDGIKNVVFNYSNHKYIFEISAKILKEDYYLNINKNNIKKVYNALSGVNLVNIKYNHLLEDSEIYRIDLCNNFKMQKPVSNYIKALFFHPVNNSFSSSLYSNKSIVFSNYLKNKKNKQRFIFYDKYYEMKKNLKQFKYVDISGFRNVLRYEVNFINKKIMRNYFKFPPETTFSLSEFLECKENVYSNVFELFTNPEEATFSPDFLLSSELKLYEIEKLFGRLFIIKEFNFDIKKISEFIKQKTKGNISNYLKEYKNLINNYDYYFKSTSINEDFEELNTLIKNAC